MSHTSPKPTEPAVDPRAAAFDAELQRRLEAHIGSLTMQLTAVTLRAEAAEHDCRQMGAEIKHLADQIKELLEGANGE